MYYIIKRKIEIECCDCGKKAVLRKKELIINFDKGSWKSVDGAWMGNYFPGWNKKPYFADIYNYMPPGYFRGLWKQKPPYISIICEDCSQKENKRHEMKELLNIFQIIAENRIMAKKVGCYTFCCNRGGRLRGAEACLAFSTSLKHQIRQTKNGLIFDCLHC